MGNSTSAKAIRRLFFGDKAQIIAWRREGVQSVTIPGHLGRHWWPNFHLLLRATTMESQSVPEGQKVIGRPKILTNTTLVLIKRQTNKNPEKKAADFKTRGPELAAISASLWPYSVGWSDLNYFCNFCIYFCDFWKVKSFCRSGIFIGARFQKIGEFCRACAYRARGKIFIFKKSQGP